HVPEPGVVVVVVDVHDPRIRAAQELDRHPVHVPAVEEHHQAVLQVRGRLQEHVVEGHVTVLARERELVPRHEHHGVLAQLLQDQLHRAQRAEGVAIRVLVGGQEELVGGADLVEHLLLLGDHAHSPPPGSTSVSSSVMRIPVSIESSWTNVSVGVRFMRSSRPIRCCRKPLAECSPASAAARSGAPPRTLTNTRALRRSALVSTPVTLTNPMRGSLRSSVMCAETISRTASLTLRIRAPAILVEDLLRGDQSPLDSNPIGELRLHVAAELHAGPFHDAGVPPYKGRGQRGALPQIVVIGLRDGGPEAALELRLEADQLLPLALEASVRGEVEVDLDQADEAHSSSRSTCLVSKTSITSPSLMSAKFSSTTPHSKPDWTSRTSSWNRRSDAIRPV